MALHRTWVEAAKELAQRAHANQFDKAGEPYLSHVVRVANKVRNDRLAYCVAWLHDVIEDCPEHAKEVEFFPFDVWMAVVAITRHRGQSADNYYAAVKAVPAALKVKLADIADNSDEARLAKLGKLTADRLRRKYAKAIKALTD